MNRGQGRQRAERIDKKHRFTLRIDPDLHHELDSLSFKYRLSDNYLYVEAISWALEHPDFLRKLDSTFGTGVDPRRGHFVYLPGRK